MTTMSTEHTIHRETAHKLARLTLFGFIVTFVLSRVAVFMIMASSKTMGAGTTTSAEDIRSTALAEIGITNE